ncbi:hypothetical protein BGW36DRAFT_447798 [Talaromyces proteolyticus]|uniref:Clr5 domain-containing protein n=1 Tax=Talaromyces proteolyticus TaxID=1131652 RepID=A0AAD4KXB9_9EURO|nr:uncharacterized protein BGW36DRAFT_447798 [Talaromyces proteolyticus]KAH8700922.1 hypothetical protein BGW36DRAFT_447798 [Talaromyces proteolyticus]
MVERWNTHKETLKKLFLEDGMTIQEVIGVMKEKHNFHASKAQYERTFRKWGFRKRLDNPEATWKFIADRIERRNRQGKKSEVCIGREKISVSKVKKEISRYNLPSYNKASTPKTPQAVRVYTPYYSSSSKPQTPLTPDQAISQSSQKVPSSIGISNATTSQGYIPLSIRETPVATPPPETQSQNTSNKESIPLYLRNPVAIDNTKASIAKFASQITCLFWFENPFKLIAIEYSKVTAVPISTEAVPTIGFQKWVEMILFTTQISHNVIILALLFIYRLKQTNPKVIGKRGSEFRLLTTALLMGNKFLDDNTYTNKTWAEVSGIAVHEIHTMEIEFLSNIRYNLFISYEDWTLWRSTLGRFAAVSDEALGMWIKNHPILADPVSQASPNPARSPGPNGLPSLPASKSHSHPTTGLHQSQNTLSPPLSAGSPIRIQSPTRQLPGNDFPQYSRKHRLNDYVEEGSGAGMVSLENRPHMSPFLPVVSSVLFPPLVEPLVTMSPLEPTPILRSPRLLQLGDYQATSNSIAPLTLPYTRSSYSSVPAQESPPFPINVFSRSFPHGNVHSFSTMSSFDDLYDRISEIPLSPPLLYNRMSPYSPAMTMSTLLSPPPSSVSFQSRKISMDQLHYHHIGKLATEKKTGVLPYLHHDAWMGYPTSQQTSPYMTMLSSNSSPFESNPQHQLEEGTPSFAGNTQMPFSPYGNG